MTRVTCDPHIEVERSKVGVTWPLNAVTRKSAISSEPEGPRTSNLVYGWSMMTRITNMRGDLKGHRSRIYGENCSRAPEKSPLFAWALPERL